MACVGTGAALEETFKKGDIKTEPRYGTAQHEEALMKSLCPDTDQDSKAEKLDMLGHSKESSEAVMGEVKFKAAFRTSSVCKCLFSVSNWEPFKRSFQLFIGGILNWVKMRQDLTSEGNESENTMEGVFDGKGMEKWVECVSLI